MRGRFSINSRLIAGFGLIIAFLAALAIAAALGQQKVLNSYETLYQRNFQNLFDIADLRANINAERLDIAVMLEVDRSQWGPWQRDLEERVRNTTEIINRLDIALRDDPWKQARYSDFTDIYEKFRSTRHGQILLLEQGRTEEAERIFAGVQTDRHAMIREILNELVENERADALARRDSIHSQAHLYLLLIIILGSIAVLVSIVMAAALVRAFRRSQAEQERSGRILRESEERFRKSFEEGPIGMALVGLDFRFMKVNSRLCQMLGYSEDEMKNLTFPDITYPDDISSDVELAGRMFRGEIPNYRSEKRYIKKNGEVLWIGLNASVVRDEAGNPLYGMAMIEDVHERKKTLEALSRSEQEAQKRLTEIEQIYKYAPVGLFIFDREYRFLRINERMAEINGIPIEENIGKSMWEVVPDLADNLKEVYRPIFERGEPVLNVEVHGRTPKAPDIDRDWIASYFPFKSETGEVIGLIGAVLEITDRKRAEDALRESEWKFRILTETIEDVFWMSTPGVTRMIYTSPGYEKIWQMSRDSLYENPKSLLERVHSEDQKRLGEVIREFHSKGKPYQCEYRIFQPDNEVRWILERGFPAYDEKGELICMAGTCTDFTERRLIEEELAEKSRYLDSFFKYSITSLVFLDRDFNFIRVNESYARACNMDVSAFAGQNHFKLFPHEENESIFRRVVETKTPYHAEAKPFEFPEHPEWGVTYWDWILFPVLDDSGEVDFLVFSLNDVTERKKAEESLRESEARLREAQRLAHAGSWDWDARADTVIWSEEFFRIAGLDPKAHAPNYYTEHHQIYTPDSMDKIRAAVDKTLKTGEPYELELEMVRPDGTTRWIDATGEAKRDDSGKITGLWGTVVDITERKMAAMALERAAKELDRSNKDLEQFSYAVSHDLQEPLRMIVSFLQLLEKKYKGKLDESADKYIKFAVYSATRAQTMITDMLEYSRVQTRARSFEKREAEEIFEAAIGNLRAAISESNAEVTHDRLPLLYVDFSQFVSVFQNLIGNAIKFRRPGVPPKVHVSARDNGVEWLFSVRDNGIGIKPEYIGRLFQIFQRLHGKEYPGTGIGLVTSKRIVERHGGRIWVESEPEKGTVFYFAIPKTPQEHD